jgi:2-C-methyl-D-erythritol 4-phosphate cytidylyltransferase
LTDANRPFTPASIYRDCFEKAKLHGIACPARKVVDGICFSSDGRFIEEIPKKDNLYAFQTPEFCKLSMLNELLIKNTILEFFGIAELFSRNGITPAIIESNDACFKITTPLDIKLAEIMIGEYRKYEKNDISI